MERLLGRPTVMILSSHTLFCDRLLRIKRGRGAPILTHYPDESTSRLLAAFLSNSWQCEQEAESWRQVVFKNEAKTMSGQDL